MQAGAAAFVGAIDNGVEDGAARYGMARCALLAGLLLSPINTGAGHALGYGIEKISYERGNPVPHGAAVALVLPGVMRHNAPVAADKYYYAAGVAGLDLKDKSREDGAELAAAWIDNLRRRYTPYTSLSAVGQRKAIFHGWSSWPCPFAVYWIPIQLKYFPKTRKRSTGVYSTGEYRGVRHLRRIIYSAVLRIG